MELLTVPFVPLPYTTDVDPPLARYLIERSLESVQLLAPAELYADVGISMINDGVYKKVAVDVFDTVVPFLDLLLADVDN